MKFRQMVMGSQGRPPVLDRSAEDCALVLAAIQGPDGKDLTVQDVQFNWDATRDVNTFRVGYLKKAFVDRRQTAQTNANDAAAGRAPASWRVPFRSRSAGALVASAVGGDPSGSRDAATSLTFVGRVFGEAEMLALGSAYQDETGWHLKHPRL